MTKPTKSQRRAISQAGIAWAEAMAQQFRYLADQGKRAESRQRAARGLASEALAALRCVMARVRSENTSRFAPASCPHPVQPMTECDVCAQTGIWDEVGKDGGK